MWRSKNPGPRLVRDYIAALNTRDLQAVKKLVGPNCTYIDSCGGSVQGYDNCIEASRRFFALDLEYELQATSILAHPPDILVSGKMVSGDAGLARDCLWRARTEGKNLVEWQSFADGPGLGIARLLMPEVAEHSGQSASWT